MRRLLRLTVAALTGITVGCTALSVFVAEGALHIWNRRASPPETAEQFSHQTGATCETVNVTASDGAALEGWLFTPANPNGAAVIALHGVGDSRAGMLSHADFLVRAGYTVLTPDSRGHGTSGGNLVSYGLRESGDIRLWADLLLHRPGIARLYGVGQSMGAAILLKSLTGEPRLRALVADCPFSTLQEVATDRMRQNGAAVLSGPVVSLGFAYARLRYGLNLQDASPAAAVRATHIPVLLIHGASDTHITPSHSRQLHALNPSATQLWEVPGANHIASLGTAPAEYRRRVLSWFELY